MSQEGHAFRGEYLNQCARVETWAVSIFATDVAVASRLLKQRAPHLFGQKLKAIHELAQASPPVFSKPKRVTELMAKFQPYAELRSELAHATMVTSGIHPDIIFAFDNPANSTLPVGRQRFWLKPDEAFDLLTELKRIAKEICDQKVKS